MEESKKKAYVTGVICSFMAIFFIFMAINVGWNMSGQFMSIVGLFFGVLGAGSFWKPESIGQVAIQILENMQENAKRQNRPRPTKKIITTQINIKDSKITNSNITQNTKTNRIKKARK